MRAVFALAAMAAAAHAAPQSYRRSVVARSEPLLDVGAHVDLDPLLDVCAHVQVRSTASSAVLTRQIGGTPKPECQAQKKPKHDDKPKHHDDDNDKPKEVRRRSPRTR